MTLSNEIQKFLDSQIEYYVKEVKSYKEMAREYNLDANSVPDTAFGIIIGCIYSSFLQTYTNHSTRCSQDIEELTKIMIENSKKKKESIIIEDNAKLKQE